MRQLSSACLPSPSSPPLSIASRLLLSSTMLLSSILSLSLLSLASTSPLPSPYGKVCEKVVHRKEWSVPLSPSLAFSISLLFLLFFLLSFFSPLNFLLFALQALFGPRREESLPGRRRLSQVEASRLTQPVPRGQESLRPFSGLFLLLLFSRIFQG